MVGWMVGKYSGRRSVNHAGIRLFEPSKDSANIGEKMVNRLVPQPGTKAPFSRVTVMHTSVSPLRDQKLMECARLILKFHIYGKGRENIIKP